MKTIRTLALIVAALVVGIVGTVSLAPQPAKAQTCNIGGYVGAVPIGANSGLGGFSTTGGGVYVPVSNGYALLYSDGTTLVVAQKTSGSGPAMALIRVHFQELDTFTHP